MLAQPVYDPIKRSLQTDPADIASAWARHFGELAKDETGHSRDIAYWRRNRSVTELPELSALNREISLEEVRGAIEKLRNGTAPGEDGILPEVFKAALESTEKCSRGPNSEEAHAPSPMLICLWKLTTRLLACENLPEEYTRAIVVPVPKRGDPMSMDNYRGIALMPVAFKILCKVVASRLSNELEESERIRKEQSGFRPREEAPAQLTALVEIMRRYEVEGKPLFIAFIDLKKAYDLVPHGALLRKLWAIGVRGQTYKFIERVYKKSTLAVRSAEGGHVCLPYNRGVRQGCPMSPILFNVFMNDCLEECEQQGLGCRVSTQQGTQRVPGLLFADDLLLLAEHPDELQSMLAHVERWADKWEMKFGHGSDKCAIMTSGVGRPDVVECVSTRTWQVQEGVMPVVDSYKYLGCMLQGNASYDTLLRGIVSHRVAMTTRALCSIQPFLQCKTIPVMTRASVLKALVLPVALYGAELWGMKTVLCDRLQTLINKAIRWVAGFSSTSRVSTEALQVELGIPPVYASAAARRARAFVKYPTLRTWVADLCLTGQNSARRTWHTAAGAWLRRYKVDKEARSVDPKVWYRETLRSTWERKSTLNKSRGWRMYQARAFGKTSKALLRMSAHHPRLSLGISVLVQCRTETLWTSRRLARAGLLAVDYLSSCLFCGRNIDCGETVEHYMLDCPRWLSEREEFLANGITGAMRLVAELCPDGIGGFGDEDDGVGGNIGGVSGNERSALCQLLLGGEISGQRLPRWGTPCARHRAPGTGKTRRDASGPRAAATRAEIETWQEVAAEMVSAGSEDPEETQISAEHADESLSSQNNVCSQVARFFQATWSTRCALLWSAVEAFRSQPVFLATDVNEGVRPLSSEDERPNG
jgi:hypothetical protein